MKDLLPYCAGATNWKTKVPFKAVKNVWWMRCGSRERHDAEMVMSPDFADELCLDCTVRWTLADNLRVREVASRMVEREELYQANLRGLSERKRNCPGRNRIEGRAEGEEEYHMAMSNFANL